MRCKRRQLETTTVTLFQPVRFMLASPVETPAEAFERMGADKVWTEEKYDGVRCQLHRAGRPCRALLARPEGDDERVSRAGRERARDRPRRAVRRRGAGASRRPRAALLRAPAPARSQEGHRRAATRGAGRAGDLRPAVARRPLAARRAAARRGAACSRASASSIRSCSRGSRRRPARPTSTGSSRRPASAATRG